MQKKVSIVYQVASAVMTPAIRSPPSAVITGPIGAGAPSRDEKHAATVGAIHSFVDIGPNFVERPPLGRCHPRKITMFFDMLDCPFG
jgi:hypothetical protein